MYQILKYSYYKISKVHFSNLLRTGTEFFIYIDPADSRILRLSQKKTKHKRSISLANALRLVTGSRKVKVWCCFWPEPCDLRLRTRARVHPPSGFLITSACSLTILEGRLYKPEQTFRDQKNTTRQNPKWIYCGCEKPRTPPRTPKKNPTNGTFRTVWRRSGRSRSAWIVLILVTSRSPRSARTLTVHMIHAYTVWWFATRKICLCT